MRGLVADAGLAVSAQSAGLESYAPTTTEEQALGDAAASARGAEFSVERESAVDGV